MEESNVVVYPCGALRAWYTVFGSFLIIFCAAGTLQAFGVFQDFYTRIWLTNHTASEISWIGSVQVFFELALGAVGGKLYDAGHCRAMLAGASLLFSFSYFMLSFAQKGQYYQAFLTQGLGQGISIGLFFVPTCTLILGHFKSNQGKQAFAMGVVLAGGPFGAVVYTIMLNYMLNSSIGFAWSVRAAGLLSVICLLAGNMMITIPPKQPRTAASRELFLKTMLDGPYLLASFSAFTFVLGCYFPIYFVQLYAVKHGISDTLVFYSLAIINIMGVFSRIGASAFVKKIGVVNLCILSCALNGFTIFGMLGCNTPVGVVLFSVFYGIFFGSTVCLYPLVFAHFAPTDVDTGKIIGYAWGPSGIAAVVGPPLGAALVGKYYVWWRGILFAALCYIGSAILQLVAGLMHSHRMKRDSGTESLSEKA